MDHEAPSGMTEEGLRQLLANLVSLLDRTWDKHPELSWDQLLAQLQETNDWLTEDPYCQSLFATLKAPRTVAVLRARGPHAVDRVVKTAQRAVADAQAKVVAARQEEQARVRARLAADERRREEAEAYRAAAARGAGEREKGADEERPRHEHDGNGGGPAVAGFMGPSVLTLIAYRVVELAPDARPLIDSGVVDSGARAYFVLGRPPSSLADALEAGVEDRNDTHTWAEVFAAFLRRLTDRTLAQKLSFLFSAARRMSPEDLLRYYVEEAHDIGWSTTLASVAEVNESGEVVDAARTLDRYLGKLAEEAHRVCDPVYERDFLGFMVHVLQAAEEHRAEYYREAAQGEKLSLHFERRP